MALLALELNDACLVLARGAGQGEWLADSEGYALLDGDTILTGEPRAAARVCVRSTHTTVSGATSAPTTCRAAMRGHRAPPISRSRISTICSRRIRLPGDELLLALPAGHSREQLGLLLGVASECGVQLSGLVDAAVAATALEPAGERVLHLDLELHHAVLTLLEGGGVELRRVAERTAAAPRPARPAGEMG
jgi:hypothetical protein